MRNELFEVSKFCLDKLIEQHKTVSFAESCTGGLLAKAITDHSGASDAFECGVVSYSGKIKSALLQVSEETLETYGEVSAQTAIEMAEGIRRVSGADIGVSVTGIAGPTGGTPEKKVGLIYVSISDVKDTRVYPLELYDATLTRADRREYTACFVYRKILELLN